MVTALFVPMVMGGHATRGWFDLDPARGRANEAASTVADQLSSDLASLRIRRDQPPPGASAGRRVLTVLIVLAIIGGGVAFAYQKLGPRIYKQSVTITEVAMVSPAQSSVIV